MATIKRLRSFRVNPIEVVIFSTVAAVFAHSVYRLFSEADALELTALTKTAESELRAPASMTVSNASSELSLVNLGCQAEITQAATSLKVRVQGTVCTKAGDPLHKLSKVSVKNLTHGSEATVFIDPLTQGFVTDYISLQEGSNELKIQRTFEDGKIAEQKITLQK